MTDAVVRRRLQVRDALRKIRARRVTCECGRYISACNLDNHLKSELHKRWMVQPVALPERYKLLIPILDDILAGGSDQSGLVRPWIHVKDLRNLAADRGIELGVTTIKSKLVKQLIERLQPQIPVKRPGHASKRAIAHIQSMGHTDVTYEKAGRITYMCKDCNTLRSTHSTCVHSKWSTCQKCTYNQRRRRSEVTNDATQSQPSTQ